MVTVSCHAVFRMAISRHDFFDIWTGCILHVPPTMANGDSSLSGSCVLLFNVTYHGSDDSTYQHRCVLDEPVRFFVSSHCTFQLHDFWTQ